MLDVGEECRENYTLPLCADAFSELRGSGEILKCHYALTVPWKLLRHLGTCVLPTWRSDAFSRKKKRKKENVRSLVLKWQKENCCHGKLVCRLSSSFCMLSVEGRRGLQARPMNASRAEQLVRTGEPCQGHRSSVKDGVENYRLSSVESTHILRF